VGRCAFGSGKEIGGIYLTGVSGFQEACASVKHDRDVCHCAYGMTFGGRFAGGRPLAGRIHTPLQAPFISLLVAASALRNQNRDQLVSDFEEISYRKTTYFNS
jgi:hypothetical protein